MRRPMPNAIMNATLVETARSRNYQPVNTICTAHDQPLYRTASGENDQLTVILHLNHRSRFTVISITLSESRNFEKPLAAGSCGTLSSAFTPILFAGGSSPDQYLPMPAALSLIT